MALTQLQKDRIAFHLDLWTPFSLLTIDRDVTFLSLSSNEQLFLVGPESPENPYYIEGEFLCSESSILGKCEVAYNKLNATTIDNSSLVVKAGKVELRGNELEKRKQVYRETLQALAKIMGYTDKGGSRVGY